ncbi:MAG: D-alanyl-D-alanine carboxypeptidase/D-alanyl-D-alanine-endopeptidase [Bdellovibrionales bacterium]|nr:D-alanyl-D-alanine carboxypeptidase/D-alanyl-D-alanine-endopeptidase [Bdellovibrionales bacterium]
MFDLIKILRKKAFKNSKNFLFLFLLKVSFVYGGAFKRTSDLENLKEKQLADSIKQKVKAKGLKLSSLGLIISSLEEKTESIYSLHADKLFIPASLAKIPTLLSLYHFYPLSYTFKTSFISSSLVEKGILKGDLILKGGGDSSFTSESLWKLVNVLTRSNLKQVEGHLLIDSSLYQTETDLEESERSYLAPSGASSFNWNSVAFYIRPGTKLKDPAFVYANPQNLYIEVLNKVKTGTKNKIVIKRKKLFKNKEVFEIRGEIDLKETEIVKYRSIKKPALWLGYNALAFLKQRGIQISKGVKEGSCQSSCFVLAEWKSRAFPFHSYNMMKYSSNFVTRMLVSHLPLLEGAKKGDLDLGMKKIQTYLNQKGFRDLTLEEPSGLSRNNKLSPRDIKKSLLLIENQYYKPEFLSSYPLARGEGTLEKRFENLPPKSFVRAKTGSLSGVLGLAGWAGSETKQYVFVFIFNGSPEKMQKAKDLFDETLLLLIN